ncbi:hypothetical protein IWQ62_003036 [Dispira parvispora]|uniref:Uncharacterized protein n=1 Tax=Dispira parvispora TaxID=1520584 RepID=A0A9W8AUI2_9FUNG|nr:hypothetical protein IWQ62_003036 [Dispira parvispora]
MSANLPKVYHDRLEISECEIPFNPFCQPCSCHSPQQVISDEPIPSRTVTKASKRRRRHSSSPGTTTISPALLRWVDPQVARQFTLDAMHEPPPRGDSPRTPTLSLPIDPPDIPLGTNRVYDLVQQLAQKVETLERSLAHLRNLDQKTGSVSSEQNMMSAPWHQTSDRPLGASEAASGNMDEEADLGDSGTDFVEMFYKVSHEVDRGDPAIWHHYRHDQKFMTAANEITSEMLRRMKSPKRETIEQLVTHIAESHTKSSRHANLIRYSLTRYIGRKANQIRSKFYLAVREALFQHLNIPKYTIPPKLQQGKRDQWHDLPEVVNVYESIMNFRTIPDSYLPSVWETKIIPQCFIETERNMDNVAIMLAFAELFLSGVAAGSRRVLKAAKLYMKKLQSCDNVLSPGAHTIAEEQRMEEEGNDPL